MLSYKFNDVLTPMLEKTYLENKEGYGMGDFNINLMNYETDNGTSLFLDNVCSNSFFPYINIPTCQTSQSKTLKDNIPHNDINGNTVSGKITTNISNHFYQVHSKSKP